jgi:iron complex outermembrane receptor protein
VLLGLDHQRSNTNYLSIFGDGRQPTQADLRPADRSSGRSTAFYDYDQKTYQTGLYVQDQMALDNGA